MKLQSLIVCLLIASCLYSSDHDSSECVSQKDLKSALEYARQLPRSSSTWVVNFLDTTDDKLKNSRWTDVGRVSKQVLKSMNTEKFKGCVVKDILVWTYENDILKESLIPMQEMHTLGRNFDYLIFIIPECNHQMSDVFFAESIKEIGGYGKPLVVNVDRNVTEKRLNTIGEYIPRRNWICFGDMHAREQKVSEQKESGYSIKSLFCIIGIPALIVLLSYLKWGRSN